MAVNTQLQVRRGTASQWTSTNPTLAAGEIGFETDTNKFKIGNGSTAWASLSYAALTSADIPELSQDAINDALTAGTGITKSYNDAANTLTLAVDTTTIAPLVSPSFTTPSLGVATATSVNGTTIPTSKTLVVTTDKLSVHAATTSAELAGIISDETGTGSLVFASSPTLVTPNLGTPSAATLTNATGLPISTGISGLASGAATFLATPSSANLASLLTDETGTGANVFANAPALVGPVITGTSSINQILEKVTISATAATGTINYDLLTNGAVTYYTSNASGNWTLNVRADSITTLNSIMATGQSVTVAFLVTNGGTAYYQTALQVDGNAITPKWQGGTAPTSGNTSSIDIYTVTLIKTGSAAFTAIASQTKFA